MIKTINEFWGLFSEAFLMLDGHLLRAVDRIISLFAGGENFSMGRVSTGLKRGVMYVCLLSGIALVGMCGKDELVGERVGPPSKPNLSATGQNGAVILEWNKLEGANEYRTYMDKKWLTTREVKDSDSDKITLLVKEGHEKKPMMNGNKYTFQVSGVNDHGEGDKSDFVGVTPRPESLNKPATFNATPGDKSVTLVWSKVDLATHYRIYRAEGTFIGDINIEGKPIETVKTTTHTDTTGLTNDEAYTYQVEAIMRIEGEEEPVTGGRSKVLAKPRAPEAGRPAVARTEDRSSDDDFSVTLKITADANAESSGTYSPKRYQISVFNQDAKPVAEIGSATTIPRAASVETMHTINSLPYDTNLEVKVVPIASDTGDPTDDELNKKEEALPLTVARRELEAPKNLTATASKQGEITLSWTHDSRATNYDITRKEGSEKVGVKIADKTLIARLGSTCCSYTDTGLKDNTIYRYTVKLYKIVSGSGAYTLDGTSAETGTTTIISLDLNPVEYVDPFIGTLNAHGQGYQPTRVWPVASLPFGMVVFTPATGFHSSGLYGVPNDGAGATNSGHQNPTYVGYSPDIKGFSAFSFQGPGCVLAHDFLMMPSLSTSGNNDWLSNRAAGSPGNDFRIKTRRTLRTIEASRTSARNNTDIEWAEPGYYRVKTKSNVLIEITASRRTGMMRITYPDGSNTGYFHLASYTNTQGFDDGNSSTSPKVLNGSPTGLEGTVKAGTFCNEGGGFRYEMFLSGEFNRAYSFTSTRTSDGNETKVQFNISSSKVLLFKFGLSFVSEANARRNLTGYTKTDGTKVAGENEAWDFDMLKISARNSWNRILKRVNARDNTAGTKNDYVKRTSDKRRLYTFLFRSLIHPNIFSDIDGRYVGFNGDASMLAAIHTLPATQGAQYQYFSNWDIYRTQIPLVAFLANDVARDISRSLVNNANQAGNSLNTGGFTRWGVANHDSGVMGGDPASIMISTADALGATLSPADADKVIAVFNRSGRLNQGCNVRSCPNPFTERGYRRGGVTTNLKSSSSAATIHSLQINNNPFSKVLEFALADYARSAFIYRQRDRSEYAANASKKSTLQDYAALFKTSSNAWRHIFSRGEMDSRVTCHGRHKCYHEGTKEQYEWYINYNVAGLLNVRGHSNTVDATTGIVSPAAHIKGELDRHFKMDQRTPHLISRETGTTYNAGNQVGHGTPYMYHYIGLPNQTADVRRRIAKYWTDSLATYPGNEDGGSQSAQFVWPFMGLYPHSVGTDRLLLMYPAFHYIRLDISDKDDPTDRKELILKLTGTAAAVETPPLDACVKSVTADNILVNGTKETGYDWTKSYIRYRDLSESTTLTFEIIPRQSGNCDHTTWGKKDTDIPPSNTEY